MLKKVFFQSNEYFRWFSNAYIYFPDGKRYFRLPGNNNWIFYSKIKNKTGNIPFLNLIILILVKKYKYIKIKKAANPYDSEYTSYFVMRKSAKNIISM